MFRKIKEKAKKLLLSLLSVTTTGSGLAVFMSETASAANDWYVTYEITTQMPYYWGRSYQGNESWYWHAKPIDLFKMVNSSTGQSFEVFCIEPKVSTNPGGIYSDNSMTAVWEDFTREQRQKMTLVYSYYMTYHPYDVNWRIAVQLHIWNIGLKNYYTKQYGTSIGGTSFMNDEIRWDVTEQHVRSNPGTYSLDQYYAVKAAYDEMENYVNSYGGNSPRFSTTSVRLSPGQSIEISDTAGVFSSNEWGIDTAGVPAGINFSKNGNNLVVSVDSNYGGEWNGSINVRHFFRVTTSGADRLRVFSSSQYNGEGTLLQQMINPGPADPEDINISVIVESGKIRITKVDNETNLTTPQGEGSLIGAQYEVRNAANEVVANLTIGADNTATTGFLPFGTYTIRETSSSTGYLVNSAPYTATISSAGILDVTVKEQVIKGKIKITKTDSETGTCNAQGDASLAGAVYRITDKNDNVVDTLTIGADCSATSKDLPYGTYKVKEVTAPTGYLLNETEQTVSITTNGDVKVVNYTEQVIKGKITIDKRDKDNQSCNPQGEATLIGAKYNITNTKGNVVDTITIGDDCTATSKDLPYGTYKIQEVEAPTGYLIDEEVYTKSITTNTSIQNVTSDEKVITGRIKINKIDSQTLRCKASGDATLIGAKYEIRDKDNKVVDTITTGADCSATSQALPYGHYTIKEVTPSVGYLIDVMNYEKFIELNDNTYEITSEEVVAMGRIQIVKHDSETQSCKPQGEGSLVGAQYQIQNSKNEVVETLTIGDDCRALSKTLPYGIYKIVESSPSEGYYLDGKEHIIEIYRDEWVESVVSNEDIITSKITVKKYDLDGEKPLANTTFEIRRKSDGELLETVTTDINGVAQTKNFYPYGTYTVKEVSSREGYNITDASERDVKIQSAYTETVYRDKVIQGTVKLQKVSSKDNSLLANAKFDIYQTINEDGITNSTPIKVGELITDSSGVATSGLLNYGSYYLVETEAPNYFFNDQNKYYFDIREEGKQITIVASNEPIKTKITVTKKDSNVDGLGVDASGNKLVLSGAEFELWEHTVQRDSNGAISAESDVKVDGPFITNKDGIVILDNIIEISSALQQDGSYYYLKETKAPAGYKLNTEPERLVFTDQGQFVSVVELEANFEDEVARGSIEVIKEDSETNEKLSGAIFKVINSKGQVVDTITTREDGKATSKILRPDTYTIEEVKAPLNYQNDAKNKTATLEYEVGTTESTVPSKTVVMLNTHDKGDITLVKVDGLTIDYETVCEDESDLSTCKSTPKTNENTIFLPGVKFAIYKRDDLSKVVATGVTNKDGKITFTLNTGEYYYQELEAPEGYAINPRLVPFTIDENGAKIEQIVSNMVIYGSIKVYKVGETLVDYKDDDGKIEFIWENTYKPNVIFELYAAEDIIHPITEEIAFEKDSLVREIITDENGEALVENLPLGKYYVKEVTAPEEHSVYEATSNIKYIELTEENVDFEGIVESESTFVNEHLTTRVSLYKEIASLIDKTDEEKSYENTVVAGIKFGLYNRDDIIIDDETIIEKDSLIGEFTTDEDGIADFDVKLPFGKYYVKELETIEGYHLDEKEYEFELIWKQEMQEDNILLIELSDEENPIINYEIAMPKTGIDKTSIYLTTTLAIIAISGLAILITKKRKFN